MGQGSQRTSLLCHGTSAFRPCCVPHFPRTGFGAYFLQDKTFSNTQLTSISLIDPHLLLCCCSSVPKLTFLLLDYFSPLSLGKITPPFISLLCGDTSLCHFLFSGSWSPLWLWENPNPALQVMCLVISHL